MSVHQSPYITVNDYNYDLHQVTNSFTMNRCLVQHIPSIHVEMLLTAWRTTSRHPLGSLFNSSPRCAAYMRQWIESALVQIMACRLFGAYAIIKTNAGLLSSGPLGTNLSDFLSHSITINPLNDIRSTAIYQVKYAFININIGIFRNKMYFWYGTVDYTFCIYCVQRANKSVDILLCLYTLVNLIQKISPSKFHS